MAPGQGNPVAYGATLIGLARSGSRGAIFADAGGTVLVILNALRLLGYVSG